MRLLPFFYDSVRAACAARIHGASKCPVRLTSSRFSRRRPPIFRDAGLPKIVSAILERGSHPFPFRTRQLSLASPMVPGLRVRESRASLDSRPLDGKPSRGLFLCLLRLRSLPPKGGHAHVSAEALSGQRSLHGRLIPAACRSRPLKVNLRGGFFYARSASTSGEAPGPRPEQ